MFPKEKAGEGLVDRKLVRVTWCAIYSSQLALLVSSSCSPLDPQISSEFVLQHRGHQHRSKLCCQQFIRKSFWHTWGISYKNKHRVYTGDKVPRLAYKNWCLIMHQKCHNIILRYPGTQMRPKWFCKWKKNTLKVTKLQTIFSKNSSS